MICGESTIRIGILHIHSHFIQSENQISSDNTSNMDIKNGINSITFRGNNLWNAFADDLKTSNNAAGLNKINCLEGRKL